MHGPSMDRHIGQAFRALFIMAGCGLIVGAVGLLVAGAILLFR